jgi:leucyl/phenylalanyl-tRNA--protein transferase
MVRLDENEISFPDPELYDGHEGIIAFGGDLSIERIWFAYQLGIFPGIIRGGNSLVVS